MPGPNAAGRFFAVFLGLALLSPPAARAAVRTQTPGRAASGLPAVAGLSLAPRLRADAGPAALGGGLRLDLSPGVALPQPPGLSLQPASAGIPVLPTLAAPVLSAGLPQPAPVAGPSQDASLRAESPSEPSARPESGQGLFTRLARLFDGSRPAQAAEEFADYLQSPPEVPLPAPPRIPGWERLSATGGDRAPVSFHAEKSETLGEGRSIPISRDDSAPGPWEKTDAASGARVWEPPTGSRDATAFGDSLYWIDPHGRFVVYSLEKKTAAAYTCHEGPVTRFAVAGPNRVFVVVGNDLRRWDLDALYARTYPALGQNAESITSMALAEDSGVGDAMTFHLPGRRLKSSGGGIIVETGAFEAEAAVPAGRGLFYRHEQDGTRVWRDADYGSIPFRILALAADPAQDTFYAAVPEGLVVWEVRGGRYRLVPAAGLDAEGVKPTLHLDGDTVYLGAGSRVLQFQRQDLMGQREPPDTVRLWSERNPMFVKDAALHIGDLTFPIAGRPAPARSWAARAREALSRVLGRPAPPREVRDLGISEDDWRALNLPTNKRLIYDTLKGFTLNQHVLYIGETGGGKTWIATMLAKLTGNQLWMVSMNEYTRNKDLIARETFGEEGKNKTGLTMSTVLRWMQEGGILLLDEMHKPLEGIAVLNNILQNGEYRLPDGRVIKYDKRKSWIIGTMNPVKPPYKGEPPSGELSSRFGLTLDVKYLPPEEERALLGLFYPEVPSELISRLVAAAGRLRRLYPEVLPLPIAPRTLMYIAQHLSRYPSEDPADVFRKTYNPASIVEDPAIAEAIAQVLAELFPAAAPGS
ncbi:MAG: AAA family ATPase [Elusimicrobia bacterium]|nr:AAA family ATPase [Elusimicrobiota bacterium]